MVCISALIILHPEMNIALSPVSCQMLTFLRRARLTLELSPWNFYAVKHQSVCMPLSFIIECLMIKSVHGALTYLQLYHCNMFINLTLRALVGRCYRKIITSTYLLPNYTFSEHSWASTRTKK